MLWGTTAMARMLDAGRDLADAQIKMAQTAMAAGAVISQRAALMATAAWNPWLADHRELGQMAPEKIIAFSAAGAAIIDEWFRLNRELRHYLVYLNGAMLIGLPLRPNELMDLLDRGAHHGAILTARTLGTAGIALRPIHERAMENALRLARYKGARIR